MQLSREKATKDKFYTYVEYIGIGKEENGIPFSGPCWNVQKINSAYLLIKFKLKEWHKLSSQFVKEE